MNVTPYPGARGIFGRGVRLIEEDLDNSAGPYQEQLLMDVILRPLLGETDGTPISGFFGDSFAPTHIGGRVIRLTKGIGLVNGDADEETRARYRPVVLLADEDVTVPNPGSDIEGRVDLICVAAVDVDESAARDVKDLDSVAGTVTSESKVVRARPGAMVIRVPGAEDASPVAPAVPSGYVAVAEVELVAVGSGGGTNVMDRRIRLPRFAELEKLREALTTQPIVSPAGFVGPSIDAGDLVRTHRVLYSTLAGVATFKTVGMPIDPLHGYTLDSVRVRVSAAEATGIFTLNVVRDPADGGSSEVIGSVDASGTTGTRWESIAVDEVVDRTLYSYALEVTIQNSVGDEDYIVRDSQLILV